MAVSGVGLCRAHELSRVFCFWPWRFLLKISFAQKGPRKNDKWKAYVETQGEVFLAIIHEDGGRLSETAKALLNRLARAISISILFK